MRPLWAKGLIKRNMVRKRDSQVLRKEYRNDAMRSKDLNQRGVGEG